MSELRDRIDIALAEVGDEVERAMTKFKPFNSPHEGYAVLKEEVDELWDDIKANRGRDPSAWNEAVQVGAMAVRYMLDMG